MSFKENLKNYDWKGSLKTNGLICTVCGVSFLCAFTILDIALGIHSKLKAQQTLPEGKTK